MKNTQECNKQKERISKLESELTDNDATIKHLRKKAEFDMPVDMRGLFHNGSCPDSCDMIDGPCACGASHNAKEWIAKLTKHISKLQAQLTTAKKQILDYEQIEASVCPEDVGITEYVANLQAKLAEAKAENERLNELVYAYESVHAPINPLLVENKRLRNKIDEAIDVLPTYPGCAKQRLIKALTENDMANPETTKCKRCGKVVLRDLWLAHLHSDECEKLRLRVENKRLREDTLPNPLQIELGAGKVLVSKFEDADGAAGVMFACGHGQFPIGTSFGNLEGRHIPQKGEVYIRCTNLASLEILKQCIAEAEQALNPAKNKESDPQQYRPANKCITPGCGNLIDINYCPKCREDWAS